MLTKVMSREKLKLCVGLASMNSDWRLGLKISSVVCWRGRLLGARDTIFLPAHLPCQSSFMSLFQKSSKQAFSFIEKWPKHGEVWLLLMRSVARRVGHVETKKKKRKKTEAILPWVVSWSRNRELKERAIFGQFLCEFQREQNTEKKELQLRGAIWRDREKHNERVREWKRKKRHFFFT